MAQSIHFLRNQLIKDSRQGSPIILAGALYFAVLFLLSFFIEQKVLELIWVVGPGVVFPLGMLLARIMKANIFVKGNELGALAGVVGGIQALFIPIYVVTYKFMPEWLPFFVGTLTAAHFIPYIWLFRSKAYVFIIVAMALVSIVFGSIHPLSYSIVPLGVALVYGIGAVLLYRGAIKR